MPEESPCTCSTGELTEVRFARDVALLRCARHEQQTWTVGGRPASAARAHELLRDVFIEGRSRRGERRSTPPRQVVRLSSVAAPQTTGDALTALLNARGLEGSWVVA